MYIKTNRNLEIIHRITKQSQTCIPVGRVSQSNKLKRENIMARMKYQQPCET